MIDAVLECRIHQTDPFPLSIELNCASTEIHAVVGPSGSGKSTLLRSIAGIHRPHQADIRWRNEIWQQSSQEHFLQPHKRLVGSLWQQYGLFPHLTVTENVALASPLKKEKRRQQIHELLRELHLAERAQAYPQDLSGGEQQRVALARALARRAPLLLLDEPFNALDRPLRSELLQMTRSLCRSHQLTVIWVTHDMEDAFLISDRISLLHNGQWIRTDTPKELVNNPQKVYLIKQLGWQNCFECEVDPINQDSQKIYWQGCVLTSHCTLPNATRFAWTIPASAIRLVNANCTEPNTFKVSVVSNEFHVKEKLLRVRLGEVDLVVTDPGRDAAPGDNLYIHLPPNQLYIVEH